MPSNTASASEADGADLIAAFQKGGQRKPQKQRSFSPTNFISDEAPANEDSNGQQRQQQPKARKLVAVRVPPVRRRGHYIYYDGKHSVNRIRRETTKHGNTFYDVELVDGTERKVALDELLSLDHGYDSLQLFQRHDDGVAGSDNTDGNMRDLRLRSKVRKTRNDGFISVEGLDLSSDESEDEPSQKPLRKRLSALRRGSGASRRNTTIDSSTDSDASTANQRRRRKTTQEPLRRSNRRYAPAASSEEDEDEDEDDEDDSSSIDLLQSDLKPRKRKRGRPSTKPPKPEKIPRVGMRQSGRANRAQNNMEEIDIDDIYRMDSDEPKEAFIKIVNAKETFETLPRTDMFRSRHVEACEVCKSGNNGAPLIYCQGCSASYHKNCIGNRSTRDHLVTKVNEDYYVLQCRRCVNIYKKKDPFAPDLSMCQDCRHSNPACKPFRHRKTTIQEQKDRDENNGLDPVIHISPDLVNNARNVLFRCTRCARAWHYHHLPPLALYGTGVQLDEEETADERFREYSKTWTCKDCTDTQKQEVGGIIAWRPSDIEAYQPGTSCYEINEDEKQYLIKWKNQSYFRAAWFSGAWTWGVTNHSTRSSFFKNETGPKMRSEDAIPEEYLRIDIVLDIKYTSYVDVRTEEIDKARIKEVDEALIKYKGLGYEDAVWEKVPTVDDGDRWLDFVTAYNDWVAGRYMRYPKQGPLKARLEKLRATPFDTLVKQKQPDSLVGGELMKYQLDGLNWIYYQWYSQKNGILADEMGLGKTIQVIAFIATLIEEHSCYPFLIVVPNATVANWRREIKQWVPSLRVVTYFGGAKPCDMARRYEMYPEGAKDLRAHVVVTSYETAIDPAARRIFKSVNWAGLIADEGQRLKNENSQSHEALNSIKSPFRLLLTGTPLQNNARELFNLLQFLDDSLNAADLEEKYAVMNSENVRELHDQIRPYILRRTKAQVLTFLPPLGQVIVPLSMSVLQKNVYKSILSRNPELLRTLFTGGSTKSKERANLSNILMQLRKCLCHPFVYEKTIEDRSLNAVSSHRTLVEASAKFQLLELLLPKLKERGHRVLIFSQFLDMLVMMEDLLDGLQLEYTRLDGTTGPLLKQKRIDLFNALDSSLFAFLISTRAGGVGINLATADTVIILDPDFNPHQDLQAISRAHRIGQKNKVLCFQLMTRNSVEEKIVQMGRKKMALDHVVVEQMGEEKIDAEDVDTILKFGAAELFKDDNAEQDIRYDEASIDKLLDRSQIENTRISNDSSAESQFSFARVWANDQGTLQDNLETPDEEAAPPDPGVWDKILKERQEHAAAEALARAEALGRGKRARAVVNYETDTTKKVVEGSDNETLPLSPVKNIKKDKRFKKSKDRSEDDTDFHVSSADEESDAHDSGAEDVAADVAGLGDEVVRQRSASTAANKSLYSQNSAVKPFERARLPIRSHDAVFEQYNLVVCPACHKEHPQGACPLKVAGVEHCGLCGLAHYGVGRTCPHIKSETQVREMLLALKSSPESKELIDLATRYLRGVKGALVQAKKKEKEKAMGAIIGPGGVPIGNMAAANMERPPTGAMYIPGAGQPQPARPMQPANQGFQSTNAGYPQNAGANHPAQQAVHAANNTNGGDQPGTWMQSPQAPAMDDHHVESALRGFLGRSG